MAENLLALVLLVAAFILTVVRNAEMFLILSPPTMIKQPPIHEQLYRVTLNQGEKDRPFALECEAKGIPEPVYRWTKNGVAFRYNSYYKRIRKLSNRGTLLFTKPEDDDEALYQCFATNNLGTSVSNAVFLRREELESFTDDEVRNMVAEEGSPVTLNCNPPVGYPKPVIIWLMQTVYGSLLEINSSRITVDPEGNLHFSNVTLDDDLDDAAYVCSAMSKSLHKYKFGTKVNLKVEASGGQESYPPVKQYMSPPNIVALRGRPLELTCIFGGTPLPEVQWSKRGTDMLSNRVAYLNYGKTLQIDEVDFGDDGTYECVGSNGIGAPQSHSMKVEVNDIPSWITVPNNTIASEDEDVVFECSPRGVPEPNLQWMINGEPLEKAQPNPRRTLEGNVLTIVNLEKSDTAVYQCNASNYLGYAFRDFYLNVLALPARITVKPAPLTKAVVTSVITLKCRVFGSPRPDIKWSRERQELSGGRYRVLDNGDLKIKDVFFTDQGTYTCSATNKFGEHVASGRLEVREKTKIIQPPENLEVAVGKSAIFRCNAKADTGLVLSIEWMFNGQLLHFDQEPRMLKIKDNSFVITRTMEIHSGIYTCVARTELDEDTAQAILTVKDYGKAALDKKKVPRGPRFIKEPESRTLDLHSRSQVNDVVFQCLADGYPPPTYKWYKQDLANDGPWPEYINPLSDSRYTQTDGTLIINNPELSRDDGEYHCTSENPYGIIISRPVQLRFEDLGEFQPKRSSEHGTENWGKSVFCDAPNHHADIKYHWSKSSLEDLVLDDERIFASYDGNLYFSSLKKEDAGNYSCSIQSVASLSYRTGPFFSLQVEPSSGGQHLLFANDFPKVFPKAPLAGEDVRLECFAYGDPVPLYKWNRSGLTNELPQRSYFEIYNRVLVLPKATLEDQGDYFCTVSSGAESITEKVTLKIQAKPEFTIHLKNKIVDKGSSIVWTCEAFGDPTVQYSWLKDGKVLSSDTNSEARYRTNENILTIENIDESDQGMYQCEAKNHLGSAYSSAQLRLLSLEPSFHEHPVDSYLYAGEGGNITIPCYLEAAPLPEFMWKKNNSSINTSERMQIFSNGYLHISRVQSDDEGVYTCETKNEHASDQSSVLLRVFCMPRFADGLPSQVTSVVRESVELPCKAEVSVGLDLTYIWLLNGIRIETERNPEFMVGKSPGYLKILNVTPAQAGTYQCVAKTVIGEITAIIKLLVLGPPGAPGAVLATNLMTTSGKIHWRDGADNGSPVEAYMIEGRTNPNPTWITLQKDIVEWKIMPESGRKEAELSNLSPWSNYSFRVSARNEFGYGKPSEPSPSYSTQPDKPHVAPSNVNGGGGRVGCLTITWNPLSPQEWNAPDLWYKILYKPLSPEANFIEVQKKSKSGYLVVDVGEENYYKPYLVKVQAVNSIGSGPFSEEVQIHSAEKVPLIQLSQVHVSAFNSTALNVSWAPVDLRRENLRGELIGFKFKYWLKEENPERNSGIFAKRGQENWGLLLGLQPNTEYYATAMVWNDAGTGVESEPALAKTFKSAPLRRPPTSVILKAISPTSVLVTWRPVMTNEEEEPILGYKVRYWEYEQYTSSLKEVVRYANGEELHALICELTPGKTYKLRVLAFSIGGDGRMSSPPTIFRTDPDTFPVAVTAVNASSTSIDLQWEPPPQKIICGEVLGYKITYWPQDKLEHKTEIAVQDPNLRHYTLHGLNTGTPYLISVQVFNPAGNSPEVSVTVPDRNGSS